MKLWWPQPYMPTRLPSFRTPMWRRPAIHNWQMAYIGSFSISLSKYLSWAEWTPTYDLKWQQRPLLCLSFSESHSVISDSLRPHGLYPNSLLYPWNYPGKNSGMGSYSLLQGIFLTQRSNTYIAGGFFTVWATGETLIVLLPSPRFSKMLLSNIFSPSCICPWQ